MSDLSPKQLARLVALAVEAVADQMRESISGEVMRGIHLERLRDEETWHERYSGAMRDLKTAQNRESALVGALMRERRECADLARQFEANEAPDELLPGEIADAILARGDVG